MLGLIDLMTRDISPNHILIEINNTGPGNAVNEMSDVILIFKFATHNFGVRFTVISVIIFFHYTSAHAKDRDLLNFLMLPYIHWR